MYVANCMHNFVCLTYAANESINLPQSEMILSNAKFCLLLPGNTLDLSTLLNLKKFRLRGNKEGALAAMRLLEREGLGKLIPKSARRGTSTVSFSILYVVH